MRFRVQWLDTASDDVRDWGTYVARQTSKRNALQLVRRLEGKVNEAARVARVLAVVGGHEEPREVR